MHKESLSMKDRQKAVHCIDVYCSCSDPHGSTHRSITVIRRCGCHVLAGDSPTNLRLRIYSVSPGINGRSKCSIMINGVHRPCLCRNFCRYDRYGRIVDQMAQFRGSRSPAGLSHKALRVVQNLGMLKTKFAFRNKWRHFLLAVDCWQLSKSWKCCGSVFSRTISLESSIGIDQ